MIRFNHRNIEKPDIVVAILTPTSHKILLDTDQRCPSRLKMCRCRTAVIQRKRISGDAARHRFSGESMPHRRRAARISQDMSPFRCHPATTKSFLAPLPRRKIFENTCRCLATIAVVTQISHKEACFYY